MKKHYWKWGLGLGVLFIGMIALTGGIVMLLWNHLVPELFNGPQIHFGQALGLLILGRLLTGNMGWGKGRGRCGGHRGHHWREKWANMSPEDREKMREKFYSYCGYKKSGASPADPEKAE